MEQTIDAYEEPHPLSGGSRRGDWMFDAISRHHPTGWLYEGTAVLVLLRRNDQEELWAGEVEERTDSGCLLRLWGSGRLLSVPFANVLRAGTVPRHTHAEFREVAALQRKGLPARTRAEQPVIQVQGVTLAKLDAYRAARGLTRAEATEKLLELALGRLAAVRRHDDKRRRSSAAP